MSDALQEVVDYALAAKLPVVIEDLDFSANKKLLASMSPARARMLSSLAYAQYRQLTESKCFRMGVALLVFNPAYTSVAGRIKYAVPYGRSVHLAAAGVIARRGQGLTEKLPKAVVGRDLTVFLRKDYLATRALRLGATGGNASRSSRRPSDGTVPSRGRTLMLNSSDEQVCSQLI
jgi:IS605 OrfB family transposase